MSHIIEMKVENYSNIFIVKFHQNSGKGSIFEMVRLFLRSVYIKTLVISFEYRIQKIRERKLIKVYDYLE